MNEAPHSCSLEAFLPDPGERATVAKDGKLPTTSKTQAQSNLKAVYTGHNITTPHCRSHNPGFQDIGASDKPCSASDDLIEGSAAPGNAVTVTDI